MTAGSVATTDAESGRRRAGPVVNRWAILALPAVAFLVVFFLVPLVAMSSRSVTEPVGAGLDNYAKFFGGEGNLRILRNTFWVATIATVSTLLIGYPYAYLMTVARPRIAGLLLIGVLLPFWSSLLVRTFAWQIILRDTGVINTSCSTAAS